MLKIHSTYGCLYLLLQPLRSWQATLQVQILNVVNLV